MFLFKSQFEIHFTPILNFHEVSRRLLSPYQKVAEAHIQEDSNFGEFIVLIFKDEGFFIDCRWDRLIFVTQLEDDRIFTNEGILSYMYSILAKFRELEGFGKIRHMLISSWWLKESTESRTEVVRMFKHKYLHQNSLPADFLSPSDIGIVLDLQEGTKYFNKLSFGPFQGAKDIENHRLFPINRDKAIEVTKKNGIFFNLLSTHITTEVEFVNFNSLYKKHKNKIKSLNA